MQLFLSKVEIHFLQQCYLEVNSGTDESTGNCMNQISATSKKRYA